MNLGISLRPPSDAEDREGASGLSDDTGRSGDRPIETPDLRGEAAIERSDGGEIEEDSLGEGDEEPGEDEPRADGARNNWLDDYHREMERRLGPDWQTDSPGTLLKRLGWARVEDWAADYRDDVGEAWDAERDPEAREVIDMVCIYMPNAKHTQWEDVWVASDGELASIRNEYASQEEPVSASSSTGPKQIRAYIARLLPTLQIERPFLDPYLTAYYGYESKRSLVRGYVHVERWEKGGEEEGLWFFVALKPDQHVPDEEVEDYIWDAVSSIEGLTESCFDPTKETFEFPDESSPWA